MWLQRIDGVSEQWEAARQRHLRQRFICAAACLGIEMEVKCNCFLAALIPLFSFGCLAVGGQQKKTKKKRNRNRERERESKKIDRRGWGPCNDAQRQVRWVVYVWGTQETPSSQCKVFSFLRLTWLMRTISLTKAHIQHITSISKSRAWVHTLAHIKHVIKKILYCAL